jgi:uncharacterized membrane protein YfhO
MAVVEDSSHTPLVLPGESPVWKATIDTYRNNTIQLSVDTDRDGLLVVSDSYYPGWRAFVDHQPVPLFRTNYALRGIPVPRGAHRIELSFKPESFSHGLSVTLGTLGVCLVGFFLSWRRSRKPADPPEPEPERT